MLETIMAVFMTGYEKMGQQGETGKQGNRGSNLRGQKWDGRKVIDMELG
jgi:hypothetical protein